jgi:hypothetical protein
MQEAVLVYMGVINTLIELQSITMLLINRY